MPDNEIFEQNGFEYHIEDGHVVIDRYVGNEKDVTIPSEIDGKSVTKIGDGAFEDCESLTSIVIPDSVTEIGDNAFEDCESLASINIPDSVKEIGGFAFAGCTSLTSIKIPNSVAGIYYGAFWGCANLTSIEIPDSVSEIIDKAFYKCDNLKEITLPDNFESMALGDLKNMGIDPWKTKIYVQDKDGNAENAKEHPIMSQVGEQNGLRYYIDGDHIVIDSYVGDGKDITIPSEINGMPVTEIGKGAFYGCDNLKEITLPEAFANKSRDELEQMRIYPDKVEVKIRGKNGEISAYKDPTQKAKLTEAPESKTIEKSETDDYWCTVASEHKGNMYKNVIDAISELAKKSETITGAEKEKVVDEPEQSSQSKETIVSKLKEFYTLTMTRLNAVFDPEIRDFSKQIKRFSEMSESGEIKSDPYGDLSDVQREQVDGIVRILSGHINGLGFSKDGRSVPNDEKIREFVAIAAGTYFYYADEKFSMNDAIESVAQAINKEFKDDEVLSSMRVSREGIELAKAFAAEVSGIQDVAEVKKTAKEFFRQNLSGTGYDAFNMESPERPTSLIRHNGRINIGIDPRNLTVTHSPETLPPDVKTGRFNPHHRTV